MPSSLNPEPVPEHSDAPAAAPGTTVVPIDGGMDQLSDLPPAAHGIILLFALVLVIAGWRLAVLGVMVVTALVCGAVTWQFLHPLLGDIGGSAAGLGAAVFGFFLGRWVHRLGGALYGVVLLGLLGFALGALLGEMVLALGFAAVFGLAGLILGWRWARHLDAVGTALYGGVFIGLSLFGLGEPLIERIIALMLSVIGGISAAVIGIFVQLRDIARQRGRTSTA